jgi:hypothetical protein
VCREADKKSFQKKIRKRICLLLFFISLQSQTLDKMTKIDWITTCNHATNKALSQADKMTVIGGGTKALLSVICRQKAT